MNKQVLILTSLILSLSLIGLVSATATSSSYIKDISNNSLSNLTVTIGQSSSQVDFYLGNTSNYVWDTVNIPFQCLSNGTMIVSGYSSSSAPDFLTSMISSSSSQFCSALSLSSINETEGNFSFKISDLLNAVQSINTDFKNGNNTPTINSVSLNGNSSISLVFPKPLQYVKTFEIKKYPFQFGINLSSGLSIPNIILDSSSKISMPLDSILSISLNKTASDINENASILTNLINKYASSSPYQVQMIGDANFAKTGDKYVVTYNFGFGNNPDYYMEKANQIIDSSIQMFNVESLINKWVIPFAKNYTELDNYKNLLENNLGLFNYSYNASADFSNVKFQSGTHTYSVPVELKDSEGVVANKTVYLTIAGVPETFYPVLFNNSNPNVASWLDKVTGIPVGENLTAIVMDKSSLSTSQQNKISSTIKTFKFVNFTLSGNETNGVIYFKIDSSTQSVSNVNNVYLYLWNETSGKWVQLPTNYITGTSYLFSAETPHFSTFMIGEYIPPTPITTNTPEYVGGPAIVSNGNSNTAPLNTGTNNPTNLNNNPGNGGGITGAIIGVLGSPAGLTTLGIIVVGVLVTLFVWTSRKRKLNVAAAKEK